MIYSFEYLEHHRLPKIVIIGSGPAGITLAVTLAKQGIPSMILEAGGESPSPSSLDTSKGEVVGDHYFALTYSRLKVFGGSGNHWTGVCRHLDAADFEPRPDVEEHIGWPIGKADIDPFYAAAREILELPREMRDRVVNEDLREVEFALSPPVRFGVKYRDFLQSSDKASVCLDACVTSLEAEGGRIVRANVAGPGKKTIAVEIDTLVLCGGGIENSRLLLWSNEVSPEPVVKNAATLGRYWFDHPHDPGGEARIFKLDYRFRMPWNLAMFAPSPQAMRRYGILNACLRIGYPADDLRNVVRNATCSRVPVTRRSVEFLGEEVHCNSTIDVVWEQEPRAVNRIELSDTEKDVFGVPRPILHWRKSAMDHRTPKVALELMGRYLVSNGYGVLHCYEHVIEEVNYPPVPFMAGCHHMGGTRMSVAEKLGVVDRDSKIFGVTNGYVLGSSVFPTGGHANPTLTIVQLALRLAEHLGKRKAEFI